MIHKFYKKLCGLIAHEIERGNGNIGALVLLGEYDTSDKRKITYSIFAGGDSMPIVEALADEIKCNPALGEALRMALAKADGEPARQN